MFKIRCFTSIISFTLITVLIFAAVTCGLTISADSDEGAVYAPSGYGERRYYRTYTCEDGDNLIENFSCDSEEFWQDGAGYVTVTAEKSYEGNTSLKVDGKGLYLKKISGLLPETWYYLSLYGMSELGIPLTDINFGIADADGNLFENRNTDFEEALDLRAAASKQEITILCRDGSWYNRTYRFYTGDNTEVNFFITGTKGVMYLDDIRIFEASKSIDPNVKQVYDDLTVANSKEDNYVCADSDNLFNNGMFDNGAEFWEDFNGINKCVEVVTSKGNGLLHYKSTDMQYYYLPKIYIESGKYYTFSFWSMNLNGSGAKYGILSLNNPKDFISEVTAVSSGYGEWNLTSIRFKANTETAVCLAIFDNGGEAIFDKIRLFESKKGYSAELYEDMPVFGGAFSGSVFGTDGIDAALPDAQSAWQMSYNSSNEYYDYSGVDFGNYGANLIPDSTVSQFNEDGTYKSYYDLVSSNNGGVVLNANAWWDKAGNRYQYFFNNSNAYASMNKLGYYSNDITLSHTKDSSGVLTAPERTNIYLPLPSLQAKTYYLVTAWLNPSKATTLTTRIYNSNIDKLSEKMVYVNAGWQRVTWLYYTGANQQNEAIFGVYGDDSLYIDDVAVYELDCEYAEKCVMAGKLTAPSQKMLGDINGDNLINIKDLVRIKKVLSASTGDYVRVNADINYDGEISTPDVVQLKKHLLGLLTLN